MTNDKPVTVTQADSLTFALGCAINTFKTTQSADPLEVMFNASHARLLEQALAEIDRLRTAHAPSQHSDLADIENLLLYHESGGHEGDGSDEALRKARLALSALRQSPDTVQRDAWKQAIKAITDEQERLDAEAGDYLMDPNDCIDVIRALATTSTTTCNRCEGEGWLYQSTVPAGVVPNTMRKIWCSCLKGKDLERLATKDETP